MVARVTLAEVDSVRASVEQALELFRTSVAPTLREQDGYEGCYVLTTPAGQALVITFWRDEDAAEAALQSGYYAEQVSKFGTFYRSPPGRETYHVGIADAPSPVSRSGGR
jgi:heme-degrading monooxygenase HmoA